MIALTLQRVFDAGLTALVLLDLRYALREGLLSRISPAPEMRPVIVPARQHELRADLYLPGCAGRRGGVVLVPGFTEFGKEEPRVVWLARLLARIGFAVLVPDFLGLRSLRALETDVHDTVDSFRYLASLAPQVRPDRVGLIGFSYGAGPTLVAAADPAIARQVCFVISVGGYYDLADVIRFLTTGHFEWQEHRGHLLPSTHARGRFLLANLDLLRDEKDRQILAAAAKSLADGGWAEAAVPTAELTPWGSALHALLMNTDAKQVGGLITQLDPQVRDRIAFLSPSRVVGRLHAHLVIVHGVQDDFIPYTESLRLAAAAPARDRVHLAITRLLNHVDPTGLRLNPRTFLRVYLRELWQIARVVRFVVGQRR